MLLLNNKQNVRISLFFCIVYVDSLFNNNAYLCTLYFNSIHLKIHENRREEEIKRMKKYD